MKIGVDDTSAYKWSMKINNGSTIINRLIVDWLSDLVMLSPASTQSNFPVF